MDVFSDLGAGRGWKVSLKAAGPWAIPRGGAERNLLGVASRSPWRVGDYGYEVHTGPLVWNRCRSLLSRVPGDATMRIAWADAVRGAERVAVETSGREHRWITVGDRKHLVLEHPAVLVKRTTAKEQERRVVAGYLDDVPVVVENHLNVITAGPVVAKVSTRTLSVLLNSAPVDRLFRCLSGSVAVSVAELCALPLPAPDTVKGLENAADPDAFVLAAYERSARPGRSR